MKASKKVKTNFVPKVVYRTAFASVVPICVSAVACGGGTASGGGDASVSPAVACAGFACMGVGVQAFSDANDAPQFSVAFIGFDGDFVEVPDAAKAADASDGDAPAGPCPGGGFQCLGVGVQAFADGGDSG